MVSFFICCSLIGAALGLRFKVLILVPATAISLVPIMGLFTGAGLGSALISAVAGSVSLQFGYLGGLVTGVAIAATDLRTPQRARGPRSAH